MSALPQSNLQSAGPAIPAGLPALPAGVRFAGLGTAEGREADPGGGASVAGGLAAVEGGGGGGAEAALDMPVAPRGERWITVAIAASRKGITERAIRARCPGWEAEDKAVRRPRPAGGDPAWMIRTDADPALAEIVLPGDMSVNVGEFTDAQRKKMGERAAILAEWAVACGAAVRACVPNAQRLLKEDATRLFLANLKAERGIDLSARTLRKWHRAFRKHGAAGLMDGRRNNGFKTNWDDPYLAAVRKLYMTRSGLSVRYCCKLARQKAAEQGQKVCCDRVAQKFIKSIPLAQRIHAREGDKAYTDKCESYINRDWTPVRANEHWGSDHHILDLWVRVSESVDQVTGEVKYRHVRPWVTVWIDNASRKIVGRDLYIGDPSTDHILISFRRGVIAHGVPESVWVDNGKDYDSFALHGRTKKQRRAHKGVDRECIFGNFAMLGVKPHNVQKEHGQSKLIERFFGTMEGQLCRLFPDAYCGNTPANRPENLQERLDTGKAPTLQEVEAAFDQWVENIYNAGPHAGEGMEGKSPNQVYAEKLETKRTAPQELLDLLLLKHSKPVLVTQNGVRCNGFQYGNLNDTLKRELGKKVVVAFDPENPARVAIFDLAGRFICPAASNQRLPANASAAMMQDAMKAKRHARKVELSYRDTRLRRQETPLEIMFRLAANKRAADKQNTDPPPSPTLRPVRSPFESQLPAIQKAMKMPALRPAAGAEGLDLLALANAELDMPAPRPARASFSLLTALNDTPTDGPAGGSR